MEKSGCMSRNSLVRGVVKLLWRVHMHIIAYIITAYSFLFDILAIVYLCGDVG